MRPLPPPALLPPPFLPPPQITSTCPVSTGSVWRAPPPSPSPAPAHLMCPATLGEGQVRPLTPNSTVGLSKGGPNLLYAMHLICLSMPSPTPLPLPPTGARRRRAPPVRPEPGGVAIGARESLGSSARARRWEGVQPRGCPTWYPGIAPPEEFISSPPPILHHGFQRGRAPSQHH